MSVKVLGVALFAQGALERLKPQRKPHFGGKVSNPDTSTPRSLFSDPATGAKAQATRAAKVKMRAESTLRRDFHADDRHAWEELARDYKVRLAPWGEAPTRTTVVRFLRKLGLTWQDHADWSGWPKPELWIAANPDWPLRAWQGLMLEHHDRRETKARLLVDPTYGEPLLPPHSGRSARGWAILEEPREDQQPDGPPRPPRPRRRVSKPEQLAMALPS